MSKPVSNNSLVVRSQEQSTIVYMSKDLCVVLSTFLSARDVSATARTCRHLNVSLDCDIVWKMKCISIRFPVERQFTGMYKEIYLVNSENMRHRWRL